MSDRARSGLFVAEGSSDQPLADIVELLFFERGVEVNLSHPSFELLPKVGKDVRSRVTAGLELAGGTVDVIVVHRDADNAGYQARLREIRAATTPVSAGSALVPIIPVRMTEAWLLLDEAAIRQVAGNPRGRVSLGLPRAHEVESIADPKAKLRECLVRAADVTGKRRERVNGRFNEHRRQLFSWLDRSGPVTRLTGWQRVVDEVDTVVKLWSRTGE
ncbi:hypothetical protein AB0H57_12565 [Micromonospora sp. NPDC050686]|uniref:hypothetical protein n=1 Tax=Micromonospora sp. NPDC050686 TaxID=3154631 RepID=UPI0033F67C82